MLGLSGVTDPYQPLERKLELTRRCLAVLAEFRQPVTIITKNRLVTRDIDLLGELARHGAAGVFVSITSLDPELIGRLEPRTSRPSGRLEAIAALADAGIPAGVMVAPVIPGLTEHEMPAILKAAAQAGARSAGYTLVRLPMAVAGLFQDWLETHFPDRKDKILGRIRAARAGRLNDARFGVRMSGEGHQAELTRTAVPDRQPPRRAQPTPLAGLDRRLPPPGIGSAATHARFDWVLGIFRESPSSSHSPSPAGREPRLSSSHSVNTDKRAMQPAQRPRTSKLRLAGFSILIKVRPPGIRQGSHGRARVPSLRLHLGWVSDDPKHDHGPGRPVPREIRHATNPSTYRCAEPATVWRLIPFCALAFAGWGCQQPPYCFYYGYGAPPCATVAPAPAGARPGPSVIRRPV